MKTTPLQTEPYMLDVEGQRIKSLGMLISVRATSQQTGGAFNLFDVICPIAYTTPLHIHYAEDVVIFVVEGALTIFWGDEKKQACNGGYFYQPRGTPHGFRVEGNTPARIIYMTVPAGFDQFVMDEGRSIDGFDFMNAAAGYKIEVLDPLPE